MAVACILIFGSRAIIKFVCLKSVKQQRRIQTHRGPPRIGRQPTAGLIPEHLIFKVALSFVNYHHM